VLLLVDIGNTRLKAASLGPRGLAPWPAVATSAREAWPAWAAASGGAPPTRVLVSNVAGAAVRAAFAQLAESTWNRTAEFIAPAREACGMRTAYRDPARLGVDRWLASLAAWHREHTAVAVVDMGTALTVDVVTAAGLHLGGLIAPGLDLMRRSLTEGTAQLASTAVVEVAGFADNTQDAISLGCWSAVAGLLRETRQRLSRSRETAEAAWFLTGGGAPALARMVDWPAELAPDLVLEGLAIAVEAHA